MRRLLIVFLLFVIITSVPAGIAMMIFPDGSLLSLPADLLKSTPFDNYLLPGFLLAFIVGGSSLAGVYSLLLKKASAFKITILAGAVLVGWILFQIILVKEYHWLQGLYLFIGIGITLLSEQLMGKAAF